MPSHTGTSSRRRRLTLAHIGKASFPCLLVVTFALAAATVAAPSDAVELDRPGGATAMSFEERVACRELVEDVYWAHRIWPEQNPRPKPPRETVMPREAIVQKVTESLLYEAALEQVWADRLSPEQIQRELDRVAGHTRDPRLLKDVFSALGNDPFLVAECFIRPHLAEKRIRDRYASDDEMRGDVLAATMVVESQMPDGEAGPGRRGEARPFSEWWIEARHLLASATPESGSYELPEINEARGGEGYSWRRAPELQAMGFPEPMLNHTAVWTGTEMIVWGGERGWYLCLDTGWRYTPATDSWIPMSSAGAPMARTNHTAVWTGTSMIVWGGEAGQYVYLDTGGRYNPATDSWTPTSTAGVPEARTGHTAVWSGSQMIVWGGPVWMGQGGRYDPVSNSWDGISESSAPEMRESHTAVWSGSHMIVWGGSGTGGGYINTGGRYNPVTDTWSSTSTTNAPQARMLHCAVWTGSRMVVWSGWSSQFLDTGGRYNPSNDTWQSTSTADAPSPRSSARAVWSGTEMIVWGQSPTGGRYNPATDSWTAVSTAGAPDGMGTAIWSGDEMIIWGGRGDTGGRYNPAGDSWIPTATANAPLPRTDHSSIWTGAEMIVWGANSQGSLVDTGGRYDPALDSWLATSMVNAPEERGRHTAVWTGTEMIVWGGDSYGTALNTGGRYNPALDSWLPTSMVNVPEERDGHGAAWTGTEMLVWGGYNNPTYVDVGGRYDPSTDGWVPITTSNAPSPRQLHSTVWTGSEMLVWGGHDDNSAGFNTGGRYNPTTDSWLATAPAAAPEGRKNHSAVWTGDKMIVWGGHPGWGTPDFDTGGRYNPTTDSWAPTSNVGAPDGRSLHTAIWTGNNMIVWGGALMNSGPLVYYNTGGHYDPVTDSWFPTSIANAASARANHTAVWTGIEMIVWGGSPYTRAGGAYAPPIFADGFESGDTSAWSAVVP